MYHIVYCAALNVKVICNTTGDRGTMDYIDVSQLHELLKNNTPQEVINSSDSRDMFVLFVLRYAIYAAPKEQLKKEMRNEVMKAGASEGDHLHKCHLDFLTSSDIAYAVWQYLNSHDAIGNESSRILPRPTITTPSGLQIRLELAWLRVTRCMMRWKNGVGS